MNKPEDPDYYAPRIKRKTFVGPWKNIEEFQQVYDWLYAPDSNAATQRSAIEQMRIWSLRRSSLCPAAVLATIVMLEVQLKDDKSTTTLTTQELQILYASAFTRFFNYMSSIMQTHNMRTMYDTAFELGLPSFVVDLRHLCAHGQELPPLQVLQSMSQYCFGWLHDYYWAAQRATMTNVEAKQIRRKDKTQFDENVAQLFLVYDAALESYLRGARDLKTAKRLLNGKRLAQLKAYYAQRDLNLLREVFDVVVQDLVQLVKCESGNKGSTEFYIESLLKMHYFYEVAEKHVSTNVELQTLIEVTQGLFRALAIQGFIDELFHSLLAIAESAQASAVRRAGASFWALQIVKGFVAFRRCKQLNKAELDDNVQMKESDLSSLNTDKTTKRARYLLVYAGVDIKSTLIFGDSMRRPWVWVFERAFVEERIEAANVYTAPVLKGLLALVVPTLTQSEVDALTQLIDAQYEHNIETTSESSQKAKPVNKIYTAEDLLLKLKEANHMELDENLEINATTTDEDAKHYGIWSTVPVDDSLDWSVCPLGRLPWA